MKCFGLVIATAIVCSPLWLVWKVAGKEGMMVFLSVFAGAAGIAVMYLLAHWAISTVLLALGFKQETLDKERTRYPWIIFWRQ